MIDLHCHILPGLDDGARDLAHAVGMARIARADGITHVAGTPHVYKGSFEFPDLGVFDEARALLSRALREENIDVTILSGAEVHITHGLVDEVRARRKSLVLAGSAYLIVEFPHDHVFSGAKDLFFNLMSESVVPIIAHPERNTMFTRFPKLLFELVAMGALAQANAGSLLDAHGPEAGEAARRFLELGLVHFIASDGHNTHSRRRGSRPPRKLPPRSSERPVPRPSSRTIPGPSSRTGTSRTVPTPSILCGRTRSSS
jgi:protein-tyrosine phosphatase